MTETVIIIKNNFHKALFFNQSCLTALYKQLVTKNTLTYISPNKPNCILTAQHTHTHTHTHTHAWTRQSPLTHSNTTISKWLILSTTINWVCLLTPTPLAWISHAPHLSLSICIHLHSTSYTQTCHLFSDKLLNSTGWLGQTGRFWGEIWTWTMLVHFWEWPAVNFKQMVPWNWKNIVKWFEILFGNLSFSLEYRREQDIS